MSSPEPSPTRSPPNAANTAPEDSATFTTTALAFGLASNAFRDPEHDIIPLSLPEEGVFESWDALLSASQHHARLAGYALVQGPGSERRKDKGNRWIRFLICKHSRAYKSSVEEPYR